MESIRRAALSACFAVFLLQASGGSAGAEGRCASLTRSDPSILFCEDFENPGYNKPGPLKRGHAWYDRFGSTSPGQECEGPASPCGVDVVAAGQCNAPGESGGSCVFDGTQSLGFPYRTGFGGGNLGEFVFSDQPRRTFGVTLALRMSSTLEFSVPAKFDRMFGPQRNVDGTVHELLGVNTDEGYVGKNAAGVVGPFFSNVARNTPFQVVWDQDTCATANAKQKAPCSDQSRSVVRVGQWGENDVHMVAQPPVDGSLYRYPDRAPGGGAARGEWLCFQFHALNWGTRDARMRWWINGKPVIDVDHVDMTRTRGADKDGLTGLRFEHYINVPFNGSAYRYEDNLVVTGANEPVSCSAIGFRNIGDGPPVLQRPDPPVLLPPLPEP